MGETKVAILEKRIVLSDWVDGSCDEAHGAQNLFMGIIRRRNLGRRVFAVSYDVFEPLAEKEFRRFADEARARWGESLDILMLHRKGRCEVGEIAVLIRVASPHRDEAYQASRFLIEEIKHRSPIWKKEHYEDGESEWVQGHSLCQHGHATTPGGGTT